MAGTRSDFINSIGAFTALSGTVINDELTQARSVSLPIIVEVNEDGTPKVGKVTIKTVKVESQDLYFDATNYRAG